MINPTEREVLKTAIGSTHIKKISAYLVKQNIYRPDQKQYSNTHITNVFNGVAHEILEKAIFDCAAQCKRLQAQKQARKKARLEALKK